MRYAIDTIPVIDAYSQKDICPFCHLHDTLQADCLEHYMGDSKMESDIRMATNEKGFCATHLRMMYTGQEGKLGLALMCSTHGQARLDKVAGAMTAIEEICARDESFFTRVRSSDSLNQQIDQLIHTLEDTGANCIVCERINTNLQRYYETAVYLWEHEPGFPRLAQENTRICMEHLPQLLRACKKSGVSKKQRAFIALNLSQFSQGIGKDLEDLDWFIRKFDYRNREEPWGDAKTALPRVINRLKGRIVFGENGN